MKLCKLKKIKILLKVILVMILVSIVLFFSKEFISNYFVRFNLNTIEAPAKNSRVIVFAPHNDDEALGCAEFIKKTIKNGGQVKVVFTTNGDGFINAIQFDYFKLYPKPNDFIEFGYTRQQESITALEKLGVSSENIIFLGYPDGGISALWNSYWDNSKPYMSPYTKSSKTPYNNSFTKGVFYTGQNIVQDLTKIIESYKPTCVLMPHPNDRHPDHFATNAFVKYTLEKINYKPGKELLYLVHRGDWPTPMATSMNLYLVPPYKLLNTGTTWEALKLTTSDTQEKTSIIKTYKTQTRTLGLLMSAFERKNELFGEYPDLKLISRNKTDSDIKPDNSNLIIIDPLKDALTLEISRNADISQINAELSNENSLNLFLKVDSNVDEDTTYSFNLIFFDKGKIKRLNIQQLNGKIKANYISKDSIMDIKDVMTIVEGKVIHLVIPYEVTGTYKSVFINGTTFIGNRNLDKTAWRMVNK